MRRAITIGAAALIALGGVGVGAAVASAAEDTASPAAAGSPEVRPAAAQPMDELPALHGDRRGELLYGEAVSADKDGTKHFHNWQRGSVTAASDSEVTVRSSDGTSWTWAVNDDTKVRSKGKEAKLADVAKGDEVLIAGTRSGTTRTAKRVVDPAPEPGARRERIKDLRERLKDLRERQPNPRHT